MEHERKDVGVDPNFLEPDWTDFGKVTQTIYCKCGAVFRSHAKIDMTILRSVSKDPCPSCSTRTNSRRTSFDTETMTLGGD